MKVNTFNNFLAKLYGHVKSENTNKIVNCRPVTKVLNLANKKRNHPCTKIFLQGKSKKKS